MTVDEGIRRDVASSSDFTLYQATGSSPRGLTQRQADERLARWGENVRRREPTPTLPQCLRAGMRNPLVALLGSLCPILSVLGDLRGALPVALCVTEPSTVTVRRRSGDAAAPKSREVPVTEIVVGDVVLLQAGDVVPAAVRITSSRFLKIDQSALTGETLPVGTTVVGGTATGVVIGTGSHAYSSDTAHQRISGRCCGASSDFSELSLRRRRPRRWPTVPLGPFGSPA